MAKKPFLVKFWGSRGTLSSLSERTNVYGGNTACVEVRCGEEILIFDAGSGLQLLGEELIRRLKRAKGKAAKELKRVECAASKPERQVPREGNGCVDVGLGRLATLQRHERRILVREPLQAKRRGGVHKQQSAPRRSVSCGSA